MLEYLTSTPLGTLSERQALEDAFLLRLAGLHVDHGGFLRYLGPFNGDDAAGAREDLYRHLITRAPAIAVTTGTAQSRHRSLLGTEDEDEVQIELLAVSTHFRDLPARVRHSADAEDTPGYDPGIYHMLRAARRLLQGRPLGITGAKPPRHVGEAPLVQELGICAWRGIYVSTVHISLEPSEVERDEWDALRLRSVLVEPERYRFADLDPDPSAV